MNVKLKPCPFCGDLLDVRMLREGDFWRVMCDSCGATSDGGNISEAGARAYWNSRISDNRQIAILLKLIRDFSEHNAWLKEENDELHRDKRRTAQP